jgi:hypothetical protein
VWTMEATMLLLPQRVADRPGFSAQVYSFGRVYHIPSFSFEADSNLLTLSVIVEEASADQVSG